MADGAPRGLHGECTGVAHSACDQAVLSAPENRALHRSLVEKSNVCSVPTLQGAWSPANAGAAGSDGSRSQIGGHVMEWRVKAKLHAAIDTMPFGNGLYYTIQRRLTKSLPRQHSPKYFEYLDWHARNIQNAVGDWSKATVFEFGVGWDLFYNIALYCYGCNRQILFDLNRFAKVELINHEIDKLSKLDNANLRRRPKGRLSRLEDLVQMGIDYRAPADARRTLLPKCSVDAVISTNTIEHVPFPDLANILREAHRILRPGGIVSARVDYADHYCYADKSIGPYNYMMFSDEDWEKFNSPGHYQNRRRHCEYVELFTATGFKVVSAEPLFEYPNTSLPPRSTLHKHFQQFNERDLRATGGLFCMRKEM